MRCPMPENPDKKTPARRLSPEGRRALEMLTNSETSSVTEAILMAYGFPAALLAAMAQDGLVREATGTMRAGARILQGWID